MNKLHKPITWVMLCFLLVSCNKQSPQLPSNKGIEIDENKVSLLAINQNLAKKEDRLLGRFALKKDKAFKRSAIGFWYKIDQLGNGSKIKDSVNCKFSCKLISLTGNILQSDEKRIVVGKKQVVSGLEEGLKLMNKGDSATFIIPWYLAYGMKGNEPLVPPYTSIIYAVKVFN
ncbi:MAG: FKBP-type peptidyl-prolyl cis-trans isomerase [Bacteroidota bacterium]|nr:FKBP-type peptidyl-prolyl cis-trans isomerase [Bacteroidota bacterium]